MILTSWQFALALPSIKIYMVCYKQCGLSDLTSVLNWQSWRSIRLFGCKEYWYRGPTYNKCKTIRQWVYSTFQLFCRDISCYISVVFKDLKLKLGICNLLKKCMLNIKNHWNRTILKGTFFFAPIKWATSGLVRSAQNWFQSKRYVVKIVRKNSQPKKSISTTL